MGKTFFSAVLLAAFFILGTSCSDETKSYSDKVKAEKKIINSIFDKYNFIKTDNIEEASNKDTFFQMSNGVWINIIDSGNGTKFKDRETILIRYEGDTYYGNDYTEEFDGFDNIYSPLEYSYNTSIVAAYLEPTSYMQSPTPSAGDQYLAMFFGMGLVSTLNHLTDHSQVQLIIPFKMAGDQMYIQAGTTHFKKVKFKVYR